MDSLYLAILLIIVGVIIQLVNKFSNEYKEYIDKIPYLKKAIFWLSIILIGFGGYQAIYSLIKTQKYEVYASPSEIKLRSNINKDFVLKISNNKDIAVYDVNYSICFDNQSIDHSIIKIEPVNKEVIPNVPFYMLRIGFSNGCSNIVLHSISPHSTKEFYVRVNGENINIDYRISFIVYDWALEPSQFSIPTTREQFLKGSFDEKSEDKEKTGQAWFQRWEPPTNPYFPD